MPRAHWLVKSEPFKYAWDQLVDDGRTYWDGVRNYEARNNLQAMKVGDLVLYYHSNEGKEVVGVAHVVGEAYPDPTTDEEAWVVVDLEPVQRVEAPVTLADVKSEPALAEMALIKRGRISVVPVTPAEFERVLAMGKTVLRPGARPEKLPPRETPPKRNTSARRAAAAKGGQKAAAKRGAARGGSSGPASTKKRSSAKTSRKKSAARKAGAKSARAKKKAGGAVRSRKASGRPAAKKAGASARPTRGGRRR